GDRSGPWATPADWLGAESCALAARPALTSARRLEEEAPVERAPCPSRAQPGLKVMIAVPARRWWRQRLPWRATQLQRREEAGKRFSRAGIPFVGLKLAPGSGVGAV